MTLNVETIVAVSLMMAVFSAVAAVGTSLVLGAGFERLRNGFEIIRKQSGFFSDAIHKLEQKVEVVDQQTSRFSDSITKLDAKVQNVGEQASAFTSSLSKLEQKIDIVDRQAGFFSDALHQLEQKVEIVETQESPPHADTTLSTGKAEALVSHAENLLTQMTTQMNVLAHQIQAQSVPHTGTGEELHLNIPKNLGQYAFRTQTEGETIRYH